MKRTALALTTIIALLFSAIAITPCVKLVSAQTLITIEADGRVSPSTPAIQQIGDLYILTSDTGSIDIERSNMMLDGNEHTLQGGVGGITLKCVKNVTVKNLIIKATQYGVYLSECSNITISNNTITGTQFPFPFEPFGGIVVREGNYSTIVGNRLENNFFAINLAVNKSTISENNIVNNNKGIFLLDASDNTIYHNNFINNNENAKSSQLNKWDDGKEGNYWSDYNGLDLNGDGIGGWPYRIYYNNQDRYPLMKPWEPDNAPPHIFISSPENKTYNYSNVTLTFSTSEPTSKISYSLDGQENVTVAGNATLSGLANGAHNVTVYAKDEFGNMGASETVSFTVKVPFSTLLIVAPVAGVAVISAVLVIYFKKRKR